MTQRDDIKKWHKVMTQIDDTKNVTKWLKKRWHRVMTQNNETKHWQKVMRKM
jgi:hypothetical protein